MKIPNLNKHITHIRNQKIYQTWEEQKAFLSMAELSKVFNISVPQIYRILKKLTEDNKQ
jgi:Mor family transcriptional regulator